MAKNISNKLDEIIQHIQNKETVDHVLLSMVKETKNLITDKTFTLNQQMKIIDENGLPYRFASIIFTLEDPTDEDKNKLLSFFTSDKVNRAVFHKESCGFEKSCFKGYLNVKGSMKLTSLKKTPGFEKCTFEKSKGSANNNINVMNKSNRLDGPWDIKSTSTKNKKH